MRTIRSGERFGKSAAMEAFIAAAEARGEKVFLFQKGSFPSYAEMKGAHRDAVKEEAIEGSIFTAIDYGQGQRHPLFHFVETEAAHGRVLCVDQHTDIALQYWIEERLRHADSAVIARLQPIKALRDITGS